MISSIRCDRRRGAGRAAAVLLQQPLGQTLSARYAASSAPKARASARPSPSRRPKWPRSARSARGAARCCRPVPRASGQFSSSNGAGLPGSPGSIACFCDRWVWAEERCNRLKMGGFFALLSPNILKLAGRSRVPGIICVEGMSYERTQLRHLQSWRQLTIWGAGGWWWTRHSPTGSGPEGSSPNEHGTGHCSSLPPSAKCSGLPSRR